MVLGRRHQLGPFFARRISARGPLTATSDVDVHVHGHVERLPAGTACAATAKQHEGYRALGAAGPQRSPLSRPQALGSSLAFCTVLKGSFANQQC
jgi:hypothetical protein